MNAIRVMLAIALAVGLGGCSTNDHSSTISRGSTELASAMVDVDALTQSGMDAITNQSTLDGSTNPSPNNTNLDNYALVIIWGARISDDELTGPSVNWNGTLSIIGPLSLSTVIGIELENPGDTIPNGPNESGIAWKSETQSDCDGFAVHLIHDRNIEHTTQPVVLFTTPLFTKELTIDDIEHFSESFQVDEANSVTIRAHRTQQSICGQGQFSGRWIQKRLEDKSGMIGGEWLADCGDGIGRFMGEFRIESNGDKSFKGTITKAGTGMAMGHFIGVLQADGSLRGQLVCSGVGNVGEIYGNVGSMHPAGRLYSAPLTGAWTFECTDMSAPHSEGHME
jgi:hypothetical protein